MSNDTLANDNLGSPDNTPDDDLGRDKPDFPPIPKELEYLVEPAIQYARKYRFDDAVQSFLEKAEERDFETLAGLAERARLSGDRRSNARRGRETRARPPSREFGH